MFISISECILAYRIAWAQSNIVRAWLHHCIDTSGFPSAADRCTELETLEQRELTRAPTDYSGSNTQGGKEACLFVAREAFCKTSLVCSVAMFTIAVPTLGQVAYKVLG